MKRFLLPTTVVLLLAGLAGLSILLWFRAEGACAIRSRFEAQCLKLGKEIDSLNAWVADLEIQRDGLKSDVDRLGHTLSERDEQLEACRFREDVKTHEVEALAESLSEVGSDADRLKVEKAELESCLERTRGELRSTKCLLEECRAKRPVCHCRPCPVCPPQKSHEKHRHKRHRSKS